MRNFPPPLQDRIAEVRWNLHADVDGVPPSSTLRRDALLIGTNVAITMCAQKAAKNAALTTYLAFALFMMVCE